jgi:hypothetical protein
MGIFSVNRLPLPQRDHQQEGRSLVTGGYSLGFRVGVGHFFNYGGGVTSGSPGELGLRLELRDYRYIPYPKDNLLMFASGFRFGEAGPYDSRLRQWGMIAFEGLQTYHPRRGRRPRTLRREKRLRRTTPFSKQVRSRARSASPWSGRWWCCSITACRADGMVLLQELAGRRRRRRRHDHSARLGRLAVEAMKAGAYDTSPNIRSRRARLVSRAIGARNCAAGF